MLKSETMRERFLAYAQNKVHPLVWEWLNAETIRANLLEELDADLERLKSDDLAAEFQHHCPVAGANADDYKNRVLEVSGLELLTGIRFLGLDLQKPFVDIMYSSEAALSPEQLSAVKAAVREAFRVFRPKRLRFYAPAHLPRPVKSGPEHGDKRLLAAPLGVMLAQPEPVTLERVTLKRATSLAFYGDYAAIYEALQAEHPELREVVRLEPKEAMQTYLDEGYVFVIFVNDHPAGVTAVDDDVQTGLSGLCVMEIVLAGASRGQGLGALVQRRLAAELVQSGVSEDTLLFGTIGEVNVPARRTAERAGRLDLGGRVWVPL